MRSKARRWIGAFPFNIYSKISGVTERCGDERIITVMTHDETFTIAYYLDVDKSNTSRL